MERSHKHLYKNLFIMGTVVLCFLLLLPSLRLLPVGVQAQPTDANRDEFDVRIQAFFESLRRGPSTPAFDELLRGGPLGTPEAVEESTKLQHSVADLQERLGAILSFEKLDTKRVGTSITLVRYVLMYDRHPVVWTFAFYRKPSSTPSITTPSPTWVLVELHFDTDMKSLL